MTSVRAHRRVGPTGKVHGVKRHSRAGNGPRWWTSQSSQAARASAGFATFSAATWTYTALMGVIAAVMCGIATACLAIVGFDSGVKRHKRRTASGRRPRKSVTRLRAEKALHRSRGGLRKWWDGKNPKKRYRRWKRNTKTRLAQPWRRAKAKLRTKLYPVHRAQVWRKGTTTQIRHTKNGRATETVTHTPTKIKTKKPGQRIHVQQR